MSYMIVVYDVEEERINKARKVLKKYFLWVQNSVFEGEITEGKFEKCRIELSKVLDLKRDSIYFYRIENKFNYKKVVLGIEKEITDNFI
ncbi:CRISPR-associated endonuclease Cas2 [Caldisericum exile]|uniref:CRISPR-associated endoribonuclease Cas2 n=1 Tax=Caldisericum exile (strain DSM 21853 / NBRC 104410 / AZM16c01) TaxID=511051 RepID=A0A7U6GDL4_CALEA|nr:CRISPR-associated endonuclease Cas2 [Caldisericum exile]BAL80401.1 putative CRISPR-associated protein [Caldisericum exile AZM16c01]